MQSSYQQTKRRKKRVLQCQITKSVTVVRGKCGYGFTISGQNPSILSCIVPGSPAHIAGLKAGDLLYFLNGQNVSRACHDDVARMVGLSTGSLELQVGENYNSSDSSDDDYLPRTKSRYPNRVRARHSVGEKGSKHERILSSWPVAKQNSSDSLKQYNLCEEESELSSSLTSQEDHGWLNPADVGWHLLSQRKSDKKQETVKQKLAHSDLRSQPVMSTAKKISSSSAVVKRVPPVTDSIKHIRQAGPKQGKCEGIQPDISSKSDVSMPVIQGNEEENTSGCEPQPISVTENVQAIVGYIGSIETPSSHSHPHQRLQAIRNTVKRLRLEKRVHTLVLMEVKPSGVLLTNAMGKQLALYPSDRIAFSGICPDDERFFGLVTLSVPDQDDSSYLGGGEECLRRPNSTCHIFMIEPDISSHTAHVQHAQAFQVDCTTNSQTGLCDQFPRSATSLILCIAKLYRDKPSRKFDSDIVQSQAFADPVNQSEHCSSNSDSGIGSGKDGVSLEQNEQVCVVDMSGGREQLDSSSLSDSMNTSLTSMQQHVSPELDSVKIAGATFSSRLLNSARRKECWQKGSQTVSKLTPQAMPDPACLEVGKASSTELSSTVRGKENLKQNMQQFLQARQQLLEEQNCMLGSDGESYSGEHVLSLSVAEDGHAVLEAGSNGQWRPSQDVFAVPTNPPPTSIHHMTGRSAFHLLRSASAPLGKKSKPETVDLNVVGKLSPRAFPHSPSSSSAFFRSPSAPPAPFFPHRDSDDEEDDKDEDDPYIGQILEQFSKDRSTAMDDDNRRFSETFAMSKKCQKERVGVTGIQKWTKMGSFRKTENLLKQSFSQSLESLTVGEDASTAAHKLMTACSVHNIASNTNDHGTVGKTGRVASWAVHFDKLLQDPLGIKVFTGFLEKEFSDENIRFWKVCEQFRSLPNEQQRKTQAKEIYACYLSPKASDPINVDNTARSYTETFLDNPIAIMFDVAQNQILQLMKQDSYPRFLKSDLYKNMLVEELEERTQKGHNDLENISENKCDKKQNIGKENSGKRRRSILPWKHYQKSNKATSDCEPKKLQKKGKEGTINHCSNNQLNVYMSGHSTTTTTNIASSSSSNKNTNNSVGNVKKSTGLGIDLSTMRKEVFHQKEVHGCPESQVKFCRIIMPDGSTTVVCAKPGQTSRCVLSKLCEKRSISIGCVDVFLLGSDRPLDLNEDISTLGSKEIVIEKRVLFHLDLPDGKSVEAKVKPNRSIQDVLKPILNKYGYSLDNIDISCQDTIDLEMPVSKLDSHRIVVTLDSETAGTTNPGSQKQKVPLFGLFRASEKRVTENKGQGDLR